MNIKIENGTIRISNRGKFTNLTQTCTVYEHTIFYNGYTLPEAMEDFLQMLENRA